MSAVPLPDVEENPPVVESAHLSRHLSMQAAFGDLHLDVSQYIFTSFVIPFAIAMSKWYICLVHGKAEKRQRERGIN